MSKTAKDRKLARRGMVVAALLAAVAVAGCGSGGGPQIEELERPGTPQAHIKQPLPATAPSTPAPTPKPDFVIESEGKSGDKVKLEGRFGPPLSASDTDASHAALESCQGADGRQMVVRLDVTATVESGLAGHVALGFRVPYQNERSLSPPLFLMGYSEGPACSGQAEPGRADLGTLEPHQPHSFTLWLVLPDVVTPRDPHPSAKSMARQEWLIDQPEVWMDNGRLAATGTTGKRVDECKPLPKEDTPPPGYENKEIALIAGTPRIIPHEENGLCA